VLGEAVPSCAAAGGGSCVVEFGCGAAELSGEPSHRVVRRVVQPYTECKAFITCYPSGRPVRNAPPRRCGNGCPSLSSAVNWAILLCSATVTSSAKLRTPSGCPAVAITASLAASSKDAGILVDSGALMESSAATATAGAGVSWLGASDSTWAGNEMPVFPEGRCRAGRVTLLLFSGGLPTCRRVHRRWPRLPGLQGSGCLGSAPQPMRRP